MRQKRKYLTKQVIHYLFRRFYIMLLNYGAFFYHPFNQYRGL